MEAKEICKHLSNLVQLDIDAIHAYETAVKNIESVDISEQLERFKADHQRHVRELSDVILHFGNQPPHYSPDFKGFIIQGFTAIRSATGSEGALKAMKTNEELTNKTYAKALQEDLPVDVKEIVQRNYSDEQRHLKYIEQCLNNRPWESTGATV